MDPDALGVLPSLNLGLVREDDEMTRVSFSLPSPEPRERVTTRSGSLN